MINSATNSETVKSLVYVANGITSLYPSNRRVDECS